jgi:hypothetical protein
MIGLVPVAPIVDARFGRGGLGPPGMVGADGNAGAADTGVPGKGGVPLERRAGDLVETSFLGADLGSFSRLSVADCVPRVRMLALRPRVARKVAEPLTTEPIEVFAGGIGGMGGRDPVLCWRAKDW